jgi:hypothetical protein
VFGLPAAIFHVLTIAGFKFHFSFKFSFMSWLSFISSPYQCFLPQGLRGLLPIIGASCFDRSPIRSTNPFWSYGLTVRLAHLACRAKRVLSSSTFFAKFALIAKDPLFFSIMIFSPVSMFVM